jgi:nitroimidazol reductase NimA-like FMN-containing flavoprotein (pyridoxamine 5'-phosphate oxidase superfamily)
MKKGVRMLKHGKTAFILSPCIFALFLVLSLQIVSFANDTKQYKKIDVGAGEMGIKATVIEGPPIKGDQVLTEDHPEYARGMVCVECHEVAFDAITTSTKIFLLNYKQLSNDEVWKRIETFLPGRERFVLTTVYNNEPTATTVDMVLDKGEKCLYVLCEKGTEKLMHIKQNPRVCAVHFKGWTLAEAERDKKLKQEWISVQIRGNAEVIPPSDPQFETLVGKYKPVRVTPLRAKLRFDIVRITPTSATYFDTNLPDEKFGVYQYWERKD